MRTLRTVLGALLVIAGIVFTILPGSILFIIAGLMLLSVDYPKVRGLLARAQKSMSKGARKLDAILLNRKLQKKTR